MEKINGIITGAEETETSPTKVKIETNIEIRPNNHISLLNEIKDRKKN